MSEQCTCVPCPGLNDNGAYGHWNHCAECCSGSMIEEPDPDCPVEEHRNLWDAHFDAPTPRRDDNYGYYSEALRVVVRRVNEDAERFDEFTKQLHRSARTFRRLAVLFGVVAIVSIMSLALTILSM